LTEAVLVSKLGTGLDIKLGTVLDRKCRTVLVPDIKLGSKLETGPRIKVGFKLGIVLGSELGTELEKGGLGMKLDFKLEIGIGTDL
jgi:hypothetical protein